MNFTETVWIFLAKEQFQFFKLFFYHFFAQIYKTNNGQFVKQVSYSNIVCSKSYEPYEMLKSVFDYVVLKTFYPCFCI